MPAVSIIVPVFNGYPYLSRCLDSILAQTFSDFEVLVIDDGSTDLSAYKIHEYRRKDPRVSLFQQENKGQGAARNKGLYQARGEYILFVDADDEILPAMLENLYQAAEQFDHPQLVFCGMQERDDVTGKKVGGQKERFPKNFLLSADSRKDLLLMAPGPVSKLYQRKWLLDTGVVFPEGVWYEDLRTTVKWAARLERAVFVPGEWYSYYRREGSTMHNRQLERNREIIDAFDDLFSDFQRQGLFSFFYRELEFLTIYHLYLAASVRVLRQDPCSPLLDQFDEYLKQKFPNYQENGYLSRLSKKERISYHLLEQKRYRLLAFLYRMAERRKAGGSRYGINHSGGSRL